MALAQLVKPKRAAVVLSPAPKRRAVRRPPFGRSAPGFEINSSHPPVITPAPSSTIQPKLTVGEPNDKFEQEADRVADQVMRMPNPEIRRKPT